MSGHGTGFTRHLHIAVFSLLQALVAAMPLHAAIDTFAPELAEPGVVTSETAELELSSERWQRFLRSSEDRYQALAEKAAWLEQPLTDDCAEPQLALAERFDCLRRDVFARAALEATGMTTAEYAAVLHQTVARAGTGAASNQQRRQFQRLQAEWSPVLAVMAKQTTP